MRRATGMLTLTFAVGIAVGGIASELVTAQQPPVKITELLKQELRGSEGKEVIIALGEIAPGADTGKHHHPGDTFAYVLEGTLTSFEEGKPPVTVRPGEILYEPPRTPHVAKNVSTTGATRILAIYIQDRGQPRAIRAQ